MCMCVCVCARACLYKCDCVHFCVASVFWRQLLWLLTLLLVSLVPLCSSPFVVAAVAAALQVMQLHGFQDLMSDLTQRCAALLAPSPSNTIKDWEWERQRGQALAVWNATRNKQTNNVLMLSFATCLFLCRTLLLSRHHQGQRV